MAATLMACHLAPVLAGNDEGSAMSIRNSAQALIIDDGRLLCIQKQDQLGTYAVLPGGGQEPGETLHDALRRECREEIAAEIEIHELRFVREYIGRNHEFAALDAGVHEMNCMFSCTLAPGVQVGAGPLPDDDQLAVRWIPLAELVSARLYPLALSHAIAAGDWGDQPVYLGDIN
jgi:ADP-ribose pyrophosphatase YjhB (NUDIX family)